MLSFVHDERIYRSQAHGAPRLRFGNSKGAWDHAIRYFYGTKSLRQARHRSRESHESGQEIDSAPDRPLSFEKEERFKVQSKSSLSPAVLGDRSVFLNVPFDRKYEPIFIALVGGLIALGRKPHCVLEIPDSGRGRLDRLVELIGSCRTSIHDLSRVSGTSARFNMPFELGLATALKAMGRPHDFFLFESQERRIDRTLSDLKGIDAQIHGGTQRGAIGCLLDCFGSTLPTPGINELKRVARNLSRTANELKRAQSAKLIFHARLFRQLVEAATELSQSEGWIPR